MIYHLTDDESPKIILWLNNPGYRTPEQRVEEKASPWYLTDEELTRIYGDLSPTYPADFSSLAYCGTPLLRNVPPAPALLWDCVNYIMPCSLIHHPEEEICWDCVAKLDKIRDAQGYRPVMQELRDRDACRCSARVLLRSGCRCGKEKALATEPALG
jgi:hypothetical protein